MNKNEENKPAGSVRSSDYQVAKQKESAMRGRLVELLGAYFTMNDLAGRCHAIERNGTTIYHLDGEAILEVGPVEITESPDSTGLVAIFTTRRIKVTR